MQPGSRATATIYSIGLPTEIFDRLPASVNLIHNNDGTRLILRYFFLVEFYTSILSTIVLENFHVIKNQTKHYYDKYRATTIIQLCLFDSVSNLLYAHAISAI